VNVLSQHKVVSYSSEKCYTIAGKGYIIHTFRMMENESMEPGIGNALFGVRYVIDNL